MNNKLKQLIKIIAGLVVVTGLANLVFTNILAGGGGELAQVNQQTLELYKDNHYLRTQIAQKTALALIEERARELGFVAISGTLAISTPAPVAYVAQ